MGLNRNFSSEMFDWLISWRAKIGFVSGRSWVLHDVLFILGPRKLRTWYGLKQKASRVK